MGISGNTLGQSQGAIYVFTDDGSDTNSAISKNQTSNTLVFDGIGARAGGNTISTNTVVNSAESGVALYAGGNQVSTNTIIEAPAGILVAAATGSPEISTHPRNVTAGWTSATLCRIPRRVITRECEQAPS